MKKILVLGRRPIFSGLHSYLIHHAQTYGWQISVGDFSESAAQERIGTSAKWRLQFLLISKTRGKPEEQSRQQMLSFLSSPALHPRCHRYVLLKKHLLTASYVSG